jgi:hypothetical protein
MGKSMFSSATGDKGEQIALLGIQGSAWLVIPHLN